MTRPPAPMIWMRLARVSEHLRELEPHGVERAGGGHHDSMLVGRGLGLGREDAGAEHLGIVDHLRQVPLDVQELVHLGRARKRRRRAPA